MDNSTCPISNSCVQVISRELIKPSSLTPDHLKIHKLSLIDQITAPLYISLILFYEAPSHSTLDLGEMCQRLKLSLSDTLSIYYPLAGTIDPDTCAVRCDDAGAEFVSSRANAQIADVTRELKFEEFHQFIPVDTFGGVHAAAGEGTLFAAQVTLFSCGGWALAACMSHLVADGLSLVRFLNTWAAQARGDPPQSTWSPDFGAMAHHFPPRDMADAELAPYFPMGGEGVLSRAFMFGPEKLAALGVGQAGGPTRVEAVSAFIWRHIVARKAVEGKRSFATHVVNFRTRAGLLPLERAFGNATFMVSAWGPSPNRNGGGGDASMAFLAGELRKAIRAVDGEYVMEAREEDRYLKELGELAEAVSDGGVEGFMFSSWCGFPIYEVDFGWGCPASVGTTTLPFNSVAVLMPTRSGDGIQVCINLPRDGVQAFHHEFNQIPTADCGPAPH